jgi:hypothetical protein
VKSDCQDDRNAASASFRKAANAGERTAHFGLDIAFIAGIGVKADALRAYTHLLASGRTDEYPLELGGWLRAQLSDQEIDAAEAVAATIGPKLH